MDDLEKSIRRIVSESNVDVITKRMVRAEYMRQHNITILSPQLKGAIGNVLDTIVQELCDLLKKGHSLESLMLNHSDECPEEDKSNSLNTPGEYKDLNTGEAEGKDLNAEVVKDKDLNRDKGLNTGEAKDKDLNTEEVKDKDLNRDKDLNTEGVKDKDLNTEGVEDKDLNIKEVEDKDLNTAVKGRDFHIKKVEDKDFNSEEFDSKANQEHINETQPIVNLIVPSKKNDSNSRLYGRNLKADTLKRKRHKVFTADEVRDCVTLSDTDDQNSQESNCSWSFSPPRGLTSDHTWEEDVVLLPTDSDIPSLGHECKQRLPAGPNCLEVSSPSSSHSSIADSAAQVIIIDSSPERNYPDRTKSRSEDRNWLSLFSDEEVKAIMIDDRLAHDRDSCDSACDTETAQLSRKGQLNSSPGQQKTSVFENIGDTLAATAPAKKKKTAVGCREQNGIAALLGGNDHAFGEIINTAKRKIFHYNLDRIGRESPSKAPLKSRSRENLSVSVRLTPINADNIETIIDLTK